MADTLNIMFKRGPQTNLNTIINNGKSEAGCFYLTTDTNRLYVGQDANKPPVLLNQTVQIVASVDSLPVIGSTNGPAVNDFYYCTKENILAVYTGGTQWKQINANTDHDTFVSSASATVTKDADSIDVAVALNRKNKDHTTNAETDATAVNFGFSLTKADLAGLLGTSVGLDVVAISGGGATLSNTGEGANSASKVNIKAKDTSTRVAVSGDDITIQGTTYDLQASGNKITLKDVLNNTTDDVITLADDDIVLLTSANDTITAKHATMETVHETDPARTLASDGTGKFTVVKSMEDDGHGHITEFTTEEITLPAYVNNINTSATISANNQGDLAMSVTDNKNNKVEAKAEKSLYYTVNGVTYYNQADLPVYTKTQVDDKLNAVDAMSYKGTVGSSGATVTALPTSGVKAGDTYKVATAGSYGGHACDIGDLLIATGTETNGVLPSGSITWTYVPSGDDTDTHYNLSAANNKVVLTVDGGTDKTEVLFDGGDAIDITTTGSNTITVAHADVTCTKATTETIKPTHNGTAFNIIKDITVNDQGHVTGYTPATVTLPEDKDTTYDVSIVAGTANKSAKIQLHGSDNSNDSVTIQNTDEYLTVNRADADTITVNHKAYGTLSATPEAAATLGYEDAFTVVTGVTRDAGGHISGYKTKEFTLPKNTNETFSLSGAAVNVANNAATFTHSLTGSKNTNSSATMVVKSASTNVAITASGNNGASIDLVWGTF